MNSLLFHIGTFCAVLFNFAPLVAQDVTRVAEVEGQPLAANITRVVEALEFLGVGLPKLLIDQLNEAGRQRDASKLQALLDPQVVFVVTINPEVRVKVQRSPGKTILQQAGFTPLLVKIIRSC